MAHHLDSPIARQDIRLDITDLYVFRGESRTVFIIDVCHSIAGPIPAPGYHPEGMYEFKVDLDGDAVEDITYRVSFGERDGEGKQRYVLQCIKGAEATDPHATGMVIVEGTTGEFVTSTNGLRLWAARPGIRSGSSPTCSMRSAMRSKTARPSICPAGIRTRPGTCSPATPCNRSSSRYPIASWSRKRAAGA